MSTCCGKAIARAVPDRLDRDATSILGSGVGLLRAPKFCKLKEELACFRAWGGGAGKPDILTRCLAEYESEPEPCGANSAEEFVQ